MRPGQVGRGFAHFHKHVEKKGLERYIASCSSCRYYDDEEGCLNSNVTEFDIVVDGGRKYCVYWKGFGEPKKKKKVEDW